MGIAVLQDLMLRSVAKI